MLGRPLAKSTEVLVVSDEQPACYCPRALVRRGAYTLFSMCAYLLSVSTPGPRTRAHSLRPDEYFQRFSLDVHPFGARPCDHPA